MPNVVPGRRTSLVILVVRNDHRKPYYQRREDLDGLGYNIVRSVHSVKWAVYCRSTGGVGLLCVRRLVIVGMVVCAKRRIFVPWSPPLFSLFSVRFQNCFILKG